MKSEKVGWCGRGLNPWSSDNESDVLTVRLTVIYFHLVPPIYHISLSPEFHCRISIDIHFHPSILRVCQSIVFSVLIVTHKLLFCRVWCDVAHACMVHGVASCMHGRLCLVSLFFSRRRRSGGACLNPHSLFFSFIDKPAVSASIFLFLVGKRLHRCAKGAVGHCPNEVVPEVCIWFNVLCLQRDACWVPF